MKRRTKLDNPDVIPFALDQLGGVGEFVDVEDVFVRCYEIAPERFGWRKHPYPDYKKLAKALRDLEGRNPGLLIKTEDGLSRQLSAEGVEWVRSHETLFRQLFDAPGKNPPTKRRDQRVLNEMENHPLAQSFRSQGSSISIAKHQAADLLMCSPDSPPAIWRQRLESARSAATHSRRVNLLEFLDFLLEEHSEWFGGKQ